ncbi:MAG: hypothetical protein ACRDL2_16230 [Gaiellaceae bacterium]
MSRNRAVYEEALRIVDRAAELGHPVRLAGSVGVFAHSPSADAAYDAAGRTLADIDLVTRGNVKSTDVDALMAEFGFAPYTHHNVWHAEIRQMFDRDDGVHVDVFRDELNFNHPIALKRRLDADRPTIPLVELLLSKLQIVEATPKDMQDIVLLAGDHELGPGADELDADAVADTLAGDWGFWYTATANVEKARSQADGQAAEQLAELARRIDQRPKSSRWKMRAKVGPRLRWYQEVEEAQR